MLKFSILHMDLQQQKTKLWNDVICKFSHFKQKSLKKNV